MLRVSDDGPWVSDVYNTLFRFAFGTCLAGDVVGLFRGFGCVSLTFE